MRGDRKFLRFQVFRRIDVSENGWRIALYEYSMLSVSLDEVLCSGIALNLGKLLDKTARKDHGVASLALEGRDDDLRSMVVAEGSSYL